MRIEGRDLLAYVQQEVFLFTERAKPLREKNSLNPAATVDDDRS